MILAEVVRTTTFRWTLGIALALLVQSALLAGFFYWSTVRHATAEVDRVLIDKCATLHALGRSQILEELGETVHEDVHRVNLVGLFGPDAEVWGGNIAKLPSGLAMSNGPIVVDLVRSDPPDPIPNSSRAVACATDGGGRLVVAHDMDDLDYIRSLIGRALALFTVPAVLIAVGLGLILGRRGQDRFRLVQVAIDDVMGGKIGRRLPMRSSPDPFDRLSRAVNAMLDKLETALEDVRALGDDIAHELRTPLTRLRARLERVCQDAETPNAFQNVAEGAIRDIDHALSIVSAILRIREIEEAKRGTEFRPVGLHRLLADAVELYRPMADERNIGLDLLPSAHPTIVADRDLLMEAVCNLIDNAIKFTPPGGFVTCAIATDTIGSPLLRISDTGPGISADERSAVLRRFHRGQQNSATPGHGIGLSLVAAITRLHGFHLQIFDAKPGCDIVIVCPCKSNDLSLTE